MKPKLLYALQYHLGDMSMAMDLLELVCDLTLQANSGKKSPHADLLISASFNAPISMVAIGKAARAFDQVYTFRCTSQATGWPEGPNVQAAETWRHFTRSTKSGKFNYSGLWFGEADCTPLAADFIQQIHEEWSRCNKLAMGFFQGEFPGGIPGKGNNHINGNMIVAAPFGEIHHSFLTQPHDIAWDAFWCRKLVPQACASRLIFSDYRHGMAENPWRSWEHLNRSVTYFAPHPLEGETVKPVYIHGTKTLIALEEARKHLLVETKSAAV